MIIPPADCEITSWKTASETAVWKFAETIVSTNHKWRIFKDDEVVTEDMYGKLQWTVRDLSTERYRAWEQAPRARDLSHGPVISNIRSYYAYAYDILFRIPNLTPPDAPLEKGDTEDE